MPNIAALLKDEFTRIARKEIKAETAALKKSTGAYRGEIAALKRRTNDLEQMVRRLGKIRRKAAPVVETTAPEGGRRFSAKGMATNRKRLGLSAADFGLLIGASSLSVYAWESGKNRPRDAHVASIAALRSIGKKEAAARLENLKSAA